MAKAFKKPNLKLLKAIRYIQEKKSLILKCISTESEYVVFEMKSHSFFIDPSFYKITGMVFHKDTIHFTGNQITLYIK